jgi:F-type H+-transporting ATPase subunit delta
MPIDRMFIKQETTVYAQVLLDAAMQQGLAFEVSTQLAEVAGVINSSIELRSTLNDRLVDANVRKSILNEVFQGFNESLLSVLGVMVERNNLALLRRVVECYTDLAEEALGAVFIDVTTVVPLDDQIRDDIKQKYSTQFAKDVLLREHIDASILGGIVISTHGMRIDASVVSQLENARNVLSTVSSGGER